MPVLRLLALLICLLWAAQPPPLRQRQYHSFRLNPDTDWTRPNVQQAWRDHGGLVGRFLSMETSITLEELLVLGKAYATQHGSPGERPVAFYTVDYDLQVLFENNILLVSEWRPFPTSAVSGKPVRLVRTKTSQAE